MRSGAPAAFKWSSVELSLYSAESSAAIGLPPVKLEAPFGERTRPVGLAVHQREDRQAVQQHRNAVVVLEPFVPGEALFREALGELELAGKVSGAAERSQRAST